MAALPLKVGPNTVQGLESYANDNTQDPGLRVKHLEVLIEQDVSLEYIDDGDLVRMQPDIHTGKVFCVADTKL